MWAIEVLSQPLGTERFIVISRELMVWARASLDFDFLPPHSKIFFMIEHKVSISHWTWKRRQSKHLDEGWINWNAWAGGRLVENHALILSTGGWASQLADSYFNTDAKTRVALIWSCHRDWVSRQGYLLSSKVRFSYYQYQLKYIIVGTPSSASASK